MTRASSNLLSRSITLLVLLAYGLSGVVALAYEVLWARMLSLQLGVSIFGVVLTVAAFMAGLGLGSLWGARWAGKVARPLLVVAALEAAVALYALLLPTLQAGVADWVNASAVGGSLMHWYGLQGGAALLFMLLPAVAMGLGFPLVLRALAREDSADSLGYVYGINIFGGVLGALLPLVLLPSMGWTSAVRSVAVLGLMAALLLAVAAWRVPSSPREVVVTRKPRTVAPAVWLAYAGVGAGTLMLQVGWTRLYGLILLRTEYVLALLLAVFLLGMGIGSLIAPRLKDGRWLSLLPWWVAAWSLGGLWLLPHIAEWAEGATFTSLGAAFAQQGLVIAAVTLPITVACGAWLPLLAARYPDPAAVGARLYGANAVGGTCGALLAGFMLIPLIGTAGLICVAAGLIAACGLVWAPHWRWWVAWPLVGVAAWPLHTLPAASVLLPHTQAGGQDRYVFEDAVSITHVVEQPDGQRVLLTDLQRMDASSEPTAVVVQKNQVRLPLLLHPAPRSVLLLGVGTGISAAAALSLPELSRTGVELSQGALTAAARDFAPVNDNIMQHMSAARDDARRFLMADSHVYDVIVGDLFHADLVGHSTLLSVQQFARARARLAPEGIFVQWLALNQFDPQSLEIVLRSFQRVFPQGRVFIDGFRLGLIGSASNLPGAQVLAARYDALPAPTQNALSGGEGLWTWLGRDLGPVSGLLTQVAGPVQDEWWPRIEFRLPATRFRSQNNLSDVLRRLERQRPSVLAARQTWAIKDAATLDFERAYVATTALLRAWSAELTGQDPNLIARLMRGAASANPADRWPGSWIADKMWATLDEAERRGRSRLQAVEEILRVRSDHLEALREAQRLTALAGDHARSAAYGARITQLAPLWRAPTARLAR